MLDVVLSWWGIGGGLAALIAIAWFIPPLRNIALAGIAALGAAKYFERRGAAQERKVWEDAERRMVEAAKKARADAERDAEKGIDDGYDRDRKS